ncbi:MAG TPA: hypothetical protein VOA88_22045 [Candidatus Dormibacteraeota bacterium]|nr:hypothetical protein [Candidatus Dormibacteraeota bacterium]
MPDDAALAAQHARSASVEEIKVLVHDANEVTLLALLENPNFDEPDVVHLLERLDLTSKLLSAVADAGKWTSSERVRLRLARHPHTPTRIALALLRQLFLFDLVSVSLQPSAPADIRRAAEGIVLTRIPHLPVGEKLALARRGPSRIAGAVLAEGHPQAIKLALDNSFLTESQILKVLAKPDVPERVVTAIAQHPKWSCQYNVRLGLMRNDHTPAPTVLAMLPNLTVRDLKEIATHEPLAPHVKKYIERELDRRATGERDNLD